VKSSDGEKSIGPYRADGYLEIPELTYVTEEFVIISFAPRYIVFEFQGCFWHGCSKCYPDRNEMNDVSKKSMQELYDKTQIKKSYLREQGYTVIEMWECDYYEKIGPGCAVEDIKTYMETLKF
jgi:G:T-mismatch repair DNA endonuclease (very short patch repair protein)